MSGYESYLAGFNPAPPYTRETWHPWAEGIALYPWIEQHGGMPDTESRETKILSAMDGAKSYKCVDGGYFEVMQDMQSEYYIVIRIAAEHSKEYEAYEKPLPFWAYISG